MQSGALMTVGIVALFFAKGGGREYQIYRNARIRAEANRDARAAFRA